MGKLIVFFLLVALVPTSVVAWLSFRSQRASLEQAEYNRLDEARQLRKTELSNYLQQTQTNLKFLATTPSAQEAFRKLTGSGDSAESTEMASDLRAKAMADTERVIGRWKVVFGNKNGYEDVLLINSDGDIVYAHKGGAVLEENVGKSEPFRDSSLRKLWATIMKTQEPGMADFGPYKPAKTVSAFMGVPVFNQRGLPCGGLFLRLGTERINAIFKAKEEAAKSVRVYLVGADYLLRSEASSKDEKTSMQAKKVETEATTKALKGGSGTAVVEKDGRIMLSSYSPVGLMENKELGADFEWAVISEVDQSLAFKPVTDLLFRLLLIMVAGVVGVSVVAFFLARSIARPVRFVSQHAARVSEGDLTADLPELRRSDEIGALAESFRAMVHNLRDQATQVRQGVGVLSSSVAEISGTISQLAVGTSKTASAITETTTTVSQVKDAAKVSSSKAKNVSEASKQAVRISESGTKATEDTIQRMHLIKQQMESIGETVVRLSDQSKAIEEIIAAVQDLADQSNLLAVNASIEAARAGDQGKGFSVVAHEIKNLADQSKEATEQIRNILQDTRRWVSAVVMATEQGIKAVDAGVEQSALAGQSIEALVSSVVQSSQEASVIEASSDQQAVGVEQVSSAMARIEQTVSENLQSTAQLKNAAQKLRTLGEQLQASMDRYKV